MAVVTPESPGTGSSTENEVAEAIDFVETSMTPDHEPPGWLRSVALVAAVGVLAFGAIGLLLAINGWYRPALAFPLGAIVMGVVLWVARSALARSPSTTRSGHIVAAVGIVAILGITGWNAAHASQHVLINRDGGSYLNTGRWIARDGSLSIDSRDAPFTNERSVQFFSFATYKMRDGTIQFQFSHLLPAVLAEAYAVAGNRGLTHAPPILGGFSLLAFFVLAWRLMRRPWFALAAMLALAFIIPQVSFSRDSYSEIPSQVFLFTAGWLLVTSRVLPRWRVALVAGLFVGTLQALRIDATIVYAAVPPLFALAWILAVQRRQTREVGPAIGAFALGLVPGITLGLVDLINHSGLYWRDLWHHEKRVFVLIALSVIVSAVIVAISQFVVPVVRRWPWKPISNVIAVFVAGLGFAMWILRPRLQHIHGKAFDAIAAMQKAEGVPVDAAAKYFERSLDWMAWYLGRATLCAAIIGAALLVRALLRGRLLRTLAVLALFVPTSVIFLWRANAASDHIWVTRRFLETSFPLLILLGVGVAAYGFDVRKRGGIGLAVRVLSVAVAVLAVAYPLSTVVHLQKMSEKRGFLAVVEDGCHKMGPNAAVVVLEEPAHSLFDDWVPQTLRSFCGATVAIARGNSASPQALHRLARTADAQGRKLFVASATPDGVRARLPDAEIFQMPTATDTHELEQTLTHRPRHYRSESFSMVLAPVSPA